MITTLLVHVFHYTLLCDVFNKVLVTILVSLVTTIPGRSPCCDSCFLHHLLGKIDFMKHSTSPPTNYYSRCIGVEIASNIRFMFITLRFLSLSIHLIYRYPKIVLGKSDDKTSKPPCPPLSLSPERPYIVQQQDYKSFSPEIDTRH